MNNDSKKRVVVQILYTQLLYLKLSMGVNMDRYIVKTVQTEDLIETPVIKIYLYDTARQERVFDFSRTWIDVYEPGIIDKLLRRTLKQKIEYATKVIQNIADEYNKTELKRLETIKKLNKELEVV